MSKQYIESNVIEYQDIKRVLGYKCSIAGETDILYYTKEFRYSSDKILWSDYKELNDKNLSDITVYDNKLYIQYKFTQVGTGKLSVRNISLDVETTSENNGIPDCFWTMGSTNRYTPQIVYNQNSSSLFNPYSVGNSYQIYSQLSTLVNNMFGICVTYFKTEPNAKTRDVVLKEYSIEHVIDKQSVKIMVPDNALPTRELQFNTLMIDYPVQFEIHIVKSEFQKVFGSNSHPDPHDYLYFKSYMNKMYMVDAVAEPDDYMNLGTYWRVSLVPYQDFSSIKYEDESLEEETDTLVFSVEGKFKEEMDIEIADRRKDGQLNDKGDYRENMDHLRTFLEPNMKICDEVVYNEWVVVSKQYYDLSTIVKDKVVCTYRYNQGFSSEDERMISFMFRPVTTQSGRISGNMLISNISKSKDGRVVVELKSWDKNNMTGNYIDISRVKNLEGVWKICDVNKQAKTITLDCKYKDGYRILSSAKSVTYESNNVFSIIKENGKVFELGILPDKFLCNIGDNRYEYTFDDLGGFENKWYVFLMGMKRGLSNVWLYEFDGSETKENIYSKLKLVNTTSKELNKFDFTGDCEYNIVSGNVNMTNFRLWSKLCEENLHNIILSQYVVDDEHNTLIIDNSQRELLLNNKWS